MTGALHLNDNKILNVHTPGNQSDAANKYYVDSEVEKVQKLIRHMDQVVNDVVKKDDTSIMTGNLNLDGQHITNIARPLDINDAVSKEYLGGFVNFDDTTVNMRNHRVINVNAPTSGRSQ